MLFFVIGYTNRLVSAELKLPASLLFDRAVDRGAVDIEVPRNRGNFHPALPHLARPLDLCRGAQNTMADFVGDAPHDFPAA